MEKYKSNRVPEYAGYGGVPEYEAYGRLNGGIPVHEFYARNKNTEDEEEQEQRPSLHEQIRRNWEAIKAKYAAEESGNFDDFQETSLEEEEEDEEPVQYAENNFANVATDAVYYKPIDYSLYGDGFTKEFIDQMENDEEFQKILNEYIIPNEGGYNNDVDDTGGETNMGIAKEVHKNEDIKNMTRERANAIYYRDYYNWNGLNKLPYPIRGFVVDYGLPTNPQFALETVHKIINNPPNSNIIGPVTLEKFRNFTDEDYNDFLEKYRTEMKNHFQEIAQKYPRKRKFLNGWLNRADRAHLAK